jgi:hypothetical protein
MYEALNDSHGIPLSDYPRHDGASPTEPSMVSLKTVVTHRPMYSTVPVIERPDDSDDETRLLPQENKQLPKDRNFYMVLCGLCVVWMAVSHFYTIFLT